MSEKKKSSFIETFILTAILFVIVQTFLEEFAVLDNWNVKARNILVFTGLFFDLLFSIEFLVRQFVAIKRKHGLDYFIRGRGWIDFLSSIPLLLLNSGPHVLFLLASSGNDNMMVSGLSVTNLMKVVKAVRVTRVLRFIRMIKLFGKIHNAESKMAQRHIAKISTISVITIIAVLMVSGFIKKEVVPDGRVLKNRDYRKITLKLRQNALPGNDFAKVMSAHLSSTRSDFIALYDRSSQRWFGRYSAQEFQNNYTFEDAYSLQIAGYDVKISVKDLRREESWNNIMFLVLVVTVVMVFMLFYTKHFAQNVSDIIHIMSKGMADPDYNLQIKINEKYADDEIYELAKLYNEKWLVLKDKNKASENDDSALPEISLDDFFGKNNL